MENRLKNQKRLLKSKNRLTSVLLILLINLSSSCYSIEKKNAIDKISISGIFLGDSAEKLIKKLGKPIKIEHIEPEMDIEPYDKYYYGLSFFEVTSKKITGFEINDSKFQLDQGEIKIGGSIESVKNYFSSSLEYDRNQAKVRLGSSDDFLLFVFENDKVYSFSIIKEQ